MSGAHARRDHSGYGIRSMRLFYARSGHAAIGYLSPDEYETMLEEQAQAAIAV